MKLKQALRMVLAIALFSVSVAAFAQHDMQKTEAPKSEAEKSFDTMKTLAGEWEGKVTVTPPMKDAEGLDVMHVSLRVTSRGNVLVHEMQEANTPLDASKYDHPVTMFYVDKDQLDLVHYCDAGNRPRMQARVSPDGKTIEFDFVDVSGSTDKTGYMQHAVFTLVDANHHVEDWTYMLPNNVPIHAHFDLHKVNSTGAAGAR